MTRIYLGVGVVAALGLGSSFAAAATLKVSTGLDSSGNLIGSGGVSDAHWTVSQFPSGGTGAAQTVYPNNADWFGGWVGNGPNSTWIARNAILTDNGPAPYTFSTTFDLTGINLSTVSISGSWAIDDAGTLVLNGHTLGTLGSGAWGALTAFSDSTAGDFLQGVNTLSITITSDDRFLEGVRLEGTVSGTAAVGTPLPAGGWSGLGLVGMIGIGGFIRRRRTGRSLYVGGHAEA